MSAFSWTTIAKQLRYDFKNRLRAIAGASKNQAERFRDPTSKHVSEAIAREHDVIEAEACHALAVIRELEASESEEA